jgi:hypothetical protein
MNGRQHFTGIRFPKGRYHKMEWQIGIKSGDEKEGISCLVYLYI